jgi:hypothetical protein
MKRNIYISYIHSDAMNFKFKIMDRFKGRKYKFSNEEYDVNVLDFEKNEESLFKLEKKVSHSDVTIVLISKNILESKWIFEEVKASLETQTPSGRVKPPKGVIGVVIPEKGNDYSYIMSKGSKGIWRADKSKLPKIIADNILNEKVIQNKNDVYYDSFISVFRWEDFIRNFENCVNIAHIKATEHSEDYNITK